MTRNTTRILRLSALAMAIMVLVMTGVPYPVIEGGDVAVQTTPAAVEEAEASITAFALGAIAVASVAASVYAMHIDDRDASAMTDNELKLAIAQDAYSMAQTQENYITDTQNTLELGKNDARREAYRVYVDERASGASHSEAVSAAKARVDEYYSAQQYQLKNKYETQVIQGGGVRSMEHQWDDLGDESNVRTGQSGYKNLIFNQSGTGVSATTASSDDGPGFVDDDGTVKANLTLVNGTDVTYRTYLSHDPAFSSGPVVHPLSSSRSYSGDEAHELVQVYDTDAATYVDAMDGRDYHAAMDDIRAQHTDVQDMLGNSSTGFLADVDAYKQNNNVTWDELATEQPNIDPENSTLTREEYYQRQLGVAMDGPETGTVVTVESDGSNVTGELYTTWAPSTDPDSDSKGEWVTDHTYNASQGVTYVLTDSGELRLVEGNMTITEITTPDGQSVNSTEHEDVTIETSDTSDLKNQTDRLNDRINQLEQQETSGGFLGGTLGDNGVAVIALLIGAFILLSGRSGGGRTIIKN